MEKPIQIRPASVDERETLSELGLRSKAYWGYSAEFMAACREEMTLTVEDFENPDFQPFAAEQGCNIVGYYALNKLSDTDVELEALFVDPEQIGKGIGRMMLDHAKATARSNGSTTMIIQGDPNAARFYEKAGCIKIGERESGSIPGRFLPEFKLPL